MRPKCPTCLHFNENKRQCSQVKSTDKLQEHVLSNTVYKCFMYENVTELVELREHRT